MRGKAQNSIVSSQMETKLLVRICTMYYDEGLTQIEISSMLGISRPQISRLLDTAKKRGIVRVTIENPYSEEQKCEKELVRLFGIQRATVIDAKLPGKESFEETLGLEVTDILRGLLTKDSVLGAASGTTISTVSENVGGMTIPGLRVIPLIGGGSADNSKWQANTVVRNLAERFGGTYFQLLAPSFVRNPQIREAFIQESVNSGVMGLMDETTVALVGIGRLSGDETIVHTGLMDEESIDELMSVGAVANICGTFIGADGMPVCFSGENRMIGISTEAFHRIEHVVAVAYGEKKINAIMAALKGKWMHTLVTDLDTAKAIIKNAG